MSEFAITNLLQNARDGVTKAIGIIDYPHHEIHSGSAFYIEGHTTMSDTQEFWAKLTTPDTAKEMHLTWTIAASGPTDIVFYEDAAGGMTGGSSMSPINQYRGSTKGSSAKFVGGLATTSTAVGTQLGNWSIGGISGRANNQNIAGGAGDRKDELILKPNTTYIRGFISNSTGNTVSFRATWYEHAPDAGVKVSD